MRGTGNTRITRSSWPERNVSAIPGPGSVGDHRADTSALERFDKQIGTGHASADAQEIVRAASSGRVETLFLLENGAVPGAVDGGADLLDTAAVQTLRHGGDVQTLPESSMPSGGPICAIFRYASEGS